MNVWVGQVDQNLDVRSKRTRQMIFVLNIRHSKRLTNKFQNGCQASVFVPFLQTLWKSYPMLSIFGGNSVRNSPFRFPQYGENQNVESEKPAFIAIVNWKFVAFIPHKLRDVYTYSACPLSVLCKSWFVSNADAMLIYAGARKEELEMRSRACFATWITG